MKNCRVSYETGNIIIPGAYICLNGWTGGDEPDSYWNMPLAYRQCVSAEFRDQLKDYREVWGKNDPSLGAARIFWNRAKLDAWRAWSSHVEWMNNSKG